MEDKKLKCKLHRGLHVIDRRTFEKDAIGNDVIINGQKQIRWRCQCGRLNAHAAEYRGGEFMFVQNDDDFETYQAK